MKLLLITQYFPPEIGAPQNRLYELSCRLQSLGSEITVLTAMPNYPQMEIYEGYKNKTYCYESLNGLKIHRSYIYVSKSKSIIKRLLNYFSFVFSSYITALKKLDKNYDIIICESPPLFLGITAYLLSINKKAKLVFNVSDLWPESAEKLKIINNRILLSLATRLEEFIYRKAKLVSCQTKGILNNIKERFPNKSLCWLPNGVDLNFYNPDKYSNDWRKQNNFSNNDVLFFYGGIIGHAQGLEIILHTAEQVKEHKNIKFILLGSGPEKEKLLAIKKELKLEQVYFFDPVPKSKMPEIIKSIDAAIIPLKKIDLFLGAIPSKIFEVLSMNKPIILGVDGEAKELFIDKGNCGVYYEPENTTELKKAVLSLYNSHELKQTYGDNGRQFVEKHFNRDNIAKDFNKELINI